MLLKRYVGMEQMKKKKKTCRKAKISHFWRKKIYYAFLRKTND